VKRQDARDAKTLEEPAKELDEHHLQRARPSPRRPPNHSQAHLASWRPGA